MTKKNKNLSQPDVIVIVDENDNVKNVKVNSGSVSQPLSEKTKKIVQKGISDTLTEIRKAPKMHVFNFDTTNNQSTGLSEITGGTNLSEGIRNLSKDKVLGNIENIKNSNQPKKKNKKDLK